MNSRPKLSQRLAVWTQTRRGGRIPHFRQRKSMVFEPYSEDYKGIFSTIAISEYDPNTAGINYSTFTSTIVILNWTQQNKWFMEEGLID